LLEHARPPEVRVRIALTTPARRRTAVFRSRMDRKAPSRPSRFRGLRDFFGTPHCYTPWGLAPTRDPAREKNLGCIPLSTKHPSAQTIRASPRPEHAARPRSVFEVAFLLNAPDGPSGRAPRAPRFRFNVVMDNPGGLKSLRNASPKDLIRERLFRF